ncbi:MAG: hypothetical protein WAL99_01450 [Pseudonocardiaceae bacterium]
MDTGPVDREASVKLLAAILVDRPQLTGAACIGKHAMFDPIVGNGNQYRDQERVRLAKAAQLCAGCPAVQRCTSVTVAVTVEVMPAARRPPAPPPGVLPLRN